LGTTSHCADCKAETPYTDSDYTLISTHGWRLTRRAEPDESVALEWRCRACWAKYKERTGTSTGSMPRVTK
jgi:hypothetical protein